VSYSNELFARAKEAMPGGVNSPVRAFKGVGGNPIFFQSGKGAYLYDVDGRAFIDYVSGFGPMILGHAHPKVVQAAEDALSQGFSFGAPTPIEIKMAETICRFMPSIELVRLVNSGTEATMSAIRLARGFTQRNKILKFAGCYHGHADSLLVKGGSGQLTLGVPDSAGIPLLLAQETLVARYNDLKDVERLFALHGGEIAAIMVEPIAANMNCVLPQEGFLQGLREICDHYGSLLIFDEVITGFRLGLSGAQGHFNIKPDLTTLGKIIGGGLPVGAYGGKKSIMETIAPVGPVYQAGTQCGNPVVLAAGLATLEELTQPDFYPILARQTQKLVQGLEEIAKAAHVPLKINHMGSIFGFFFTGASEIACYEDVAACDLERFRQFFHGMLNEGIYLGPSPFECALLSKAHGIHEITKTCQAFEKVLANLSCGG
jgi:glutamate-1-semialdehyde 2,1-aminomutase